MKKKNKINALYLSAHVFSMKVQNYYWGHYSLCLQREMGPTFYLEQEQFGVSVLATL